MLVVTAASRSRRLTTVAAVCDHLDLSSELDDSLIGDWIDAASAAVEHYCSRTFVRERVKETFHPHEHHHHRHHDHHHHGARHIKLERFPLNSILGAWIGADAIDTSMWTFDPKSSTVFPDRWITPDAPFSIEYDAGYVLPEDTNSNLPWDVQLATILMVGVRASSRGRDVYLKSETTEGVGTTSWYQIGNTSSVASMPPEASALLARYMDYGVL